MIKFSKSYWLFLFSFWLTFKLAQSEYYERLQNKIIKVPQDRRRKYLLDDRFIEAFDVKFDEDNYNCIIEKNKVKLSKKINKEIEYTKNIKSNLVISTKGQNFTNTLYFID